MKAIYVRKTWFFLCVCVLFTCFLVLQDASANGSLNVRVQPGGDTISSAYAITGETRTYFGNVEGGTPPYEYKWEFSNGGDTSFSAVTDTRHISIDHIYGTAGTHYARLTVRDSIGASDSATVNLFVILAADDNLNRQRNSAIDRGLRYTYLNEEMTADGSRWPGSGWWIANTGMALIAFENHGHNLQSSDDDIYKNSVSEGIRYLLNRAYDVDLVDQECIGDPEADDGDSDNDNKGVTFSESGPSEYHGEMYHDPIAFMAVVNSCDKSTAQTLTVSTTDPSRFVNGQTLWDVIVDAKDFIAYAQNEGRGGGNQWYSCSGENSGVQMWNYGLTVRDYYAHKGTSQNAWYCPNADGNSYSYAETRGLFVTNSWAQKWLPAECPGTFAVDWGDGSPVETVAGYDACPDWSYIYGGTHQYASAGTYTISVSHGGELICSGDVTVVDDALENCPGTFTIDWGDGSPPEEVAGSDWNCPYFSETSGEISHAYASPGTYTVSSYHDDELMCSVDVTVENGICGESGWRYHRNYDGGDNSVTQWPVLALAEARDRWDIHVNPKVITELDGWLLYSQNTDSGGIGYTSPDYGNFARTGAGLIMLDYCGYDETNARVQKALEFLDAHWDSTNYEGNLGNYYAMYAFYKGMKIQGLNTLDGRDWEEMYTQFIVSTQQPGNYWNDCCWYDQPFATYTALAILAPAVAGLPPVADAGGPYPDVNPGQAVNLDGSGSYHQDPNYDIVKYEWDFNADDGLWWDSKPAPDSGEGALGVTATASYPDIGMEMTYTITLRVTDNRPADKGGPQTDEDTATVKVTTGNVAPIAVTNGPWSDLPGTTITFDGSASYDPNSCITPGDPNCLGDSIVSYEWDLDADGIFNEPGDDGMPVTPGDYRVVQKQFPEPISLPATLRVTDSFGLTGTSSAQYNIISIAIVYGQEYLTCFRERLSRFEERLGISVRFKNLGNGSAENLVMTLTQAPTNLQILKGISNLGSLASGDEKWSACSAATKSADIELRYDRRIAPTGVWLWRADFDYQGKHYVVDNLPPLKP